MMLPVISMHGCTPEVLVIDNLVITTNQRSCTLETTNVVSYLLEELSYVDPWPYGRTDNYVRLHRATCQPRYRHVEDVCARLYGDRPGEKSRQRNDLILAKKPESVKQASERQTLLESPLQPIDFIGLKLRKVLLAARTAQVAGSPSRPFNFPPPGKTSADYQRQPFDWLSVRGLSPE